ncbi:MAG: GNAT family N-acetyltransferase [Anaerolineae bacterium]
MPLNYHLRTVHADDLPDLRLSCWAHHTSHQSADLLRMILKAQTDGRGVGVVAQSNSDHALIAYGQRLKLSQCHEISNLFVIPQQRGQGIGTALIRYLLANLADDVAIEIGVSAANTQARALYQRLGFTEHYRLSLDLGHGTETVIYLHCLTPLH